MSAEITTHKISELFFEQIKKKSLGSKKPDAAYTLSVIAPETMEVSIC